METKRWLMLMVLMVVFAGLTADRNYEEPIVAFKHGTVRGSVLKSDENNVIYAFRGIPYAKPPVKELRFKHPEPVESWYGVLNATEDGASCIQFAALQQRFTGDEDCLFVNVYRPQISEEKKKLLGPLPVMVFIHGGGFVWGSGESRLYGPQRLIDRDVILVTFNYRLAVFGFLSTADEASPGNYGFYDQVLALRWIQENIREFGGDPDQVTLFGESAGSLSVVLHVISPLSAGLFHAAIAESGSPLCAFEIIEDPIRLARRLGQRLGCPSNISNERLVNCIRRKPALDIVVESQKVESDMFLNFEEHSIEPLYGAVPEKERNGFTPFISENWLEQFKKGIFNKVPAILGVNKDEGLYMYSMMGEIRQSKGRKQASEVLPNIIKGFNRHLTEKDWKFVYQKVYNEYFTDKMDEDVVTKQLIKFYGDIMFEHCTDMTVHHLSAGGVKVYPYKFSYARYPIINVFGPPEDYLENDTVNHADELPYLFRCEYFPGTSKLQGSDLYMSDLMVTLWTNFAKTRYPSITGARFEYPSFEWEPYCADKPRFLNISLKPVMKDGYLCEKTLFWETMDKSTPNPKQDEL